MHTNYLYKILELKKSFKSSKPKESKIRILKRSLMAEIVSIKDQLNRLVSSVV
jgi:hypothetical protein